MKKLSLILIFLTLTFSLHAQFVGVMYDGVYYFINTQAGWAAVDAPSLSVYSGDLKVKPYVWEQSKPNNPYPVISIGANAFANSPNLFSVELPSTITTIGNYAFSNCPNLTSVNIPEGVTSIGDCAFYNTSVRPELPSTIEKIGNYAFSKSGVASYLKIPNRVLSIGEKAFYENDYNILDFQAINCGKQIGDNAFPSCINSVNFSDDVKVIPDNAFKNCLLTSVSTSGISGNLPSSLEYLGIGAFSGCCKLREISLSSRNLDCIRTSTFSGCTSLSHVSMPYIYTIKSNAFKDCESLSLLELGENLKNIEDDSFSGSTNVRKTIWSAITPISDTKRIQSEINIVPNENYLNIGLKNEVYVYPNLKQRFNKDGMIFVPSNNAKRLVDIIGCTYDKNVREIDLSNAAVEFQGIKFSIDKVLPYCFSGNWILEKVNYTAISEITQGLFQNCTSLYEVEIPSEIAELPSEIFMNTALESYKVPNSVNKVGDKVFFKCKNLNNIEFGPNVLSIGKSSFGECYRLTAISLPQSVLTVGERAFYNCTSMQSFNCKGDLQEVGDEAFVNCEKLDKVILGSNLKEIGAKCFDKCFGITQLYSYSFEPPKVAITSFSDVDKWACTLHIPKGAYEKYINASIWNEFLMIDADLDACDTIEEIFVTNNFVKIYDIKGLKVFEGKYGECNLQRGIYYIIDYNGNKSKMVCL